MSRLMLHKGGHSVSRNDLMLVDCPEPEATWYPIPHTEVASQVLHTLELFQYAVKREQWALAGPNGEQMFGVLDTTCSILGKEINLAVGVRNSVDKSFAMGFCAGSRVFVCDNLAFSAELMVNRKHTRFGLDSFRKSINHAATALDSFVHTEKARTERWQQQQITAPQRDEVILRALESAVFPKTMLGDVFREHVRPTYAEFRDGSAFGMFNNFTTALRDRAFRRPNEYSKTTQELTAIIEEVVFGIKPVEWVIDVTPTEEEVQA